MKTLTKYENSQEYCWYDSSNVVFSKCYDNKGDKKVVKIVFKNGRTYLYKDVDVNDYILFRDAPSNGESFAKHIRPYTATRIDDTDLEKLDELRKDYEEESDKMQRKTSELGYVIDYCDTDGRFLLKVGDKVLYEGVEGNVSIVNLFASMGISCVMNSVEEIKNVTDEEENKINLQ